MRSKAQGFTLIELMMAIAIIGILAAIAWPQYQKYVVRNNRVAMQSELMLIASAFERFRSQQLTYKNATPALIYGATKYPKSGVALYDLNFTVDDSGLTWTVTAVPATGGLQAKANDGALAIDSTGRRCWKKGASSCDLADGSQDWSAK